MNNLDLPPRCTPDGFAERFLRQPLYPWQQEVLTWFDNPRQRTAGALVTPNGAGKSSGVVAALALWWAANFPRSRCVITTKDSKQLEQQLYPALVRYRGRLEGWKWTTSPYTEILTPTGSRIVAFTTNDAGRAEGWHKEDDDLAPLLMIVDEAKSVEEDIFQAIDRCTFNALLYVSSPGHMMGAFFHAFTKQAALFKTRHVSLRECPHIPRERIDGIVAKYGEKHPLVQSSVHGQFMDQDDQTTFVFRIGLVREALANPPRFRRGDRTAFCDFAAGGDENVLAIRWGNRMEIAATWRERDTMSAVGRFIIEFRKAELTAPEIFADEGGLGKPMIDALWHAGWEVNRINNGSRPYQSTYTDRGSEMWHETAAAVMRGDVILPVGDEDLVSQLTTRQSRVTSDGRLGMEPKHELAARGVSSPDRADAICGAWCCHDLSAHRFRSSSHSTWEDAVDSADSSGLTAIGMHPGY